MFYNHILIFLLNIGSIKLTELHGKDLKLFYIKSAIYFY
jgi:hypothetical protein